MRQNDKPFVLVVLGPTASGKSALAVTLAQKYNGEVISADSRQVYKGLDIGSGKITRKEMEGVLHHLLSVASPRGTFSAAKYQISARKIITKIVKQGKLPIMCGGTGFYIDTVLYNYDFPAVPPNQNLRKKLEELSTSQLFIKLQQLDPARADTIDQHNRHRLIRSLEIVISSGKPIPTLKKESLYESFKIGLNPEKETLQENIDKRLRDRLAIGMVQEVSNLHGAGLSWKRLDDFGLEYRYVSRFLRKMINKEEMIDLIKKESWQYVKRQLTWFKRDKEIHWYKDSNSALKKIGKKIPTKGR